PIGSLTQMATIRLGKRTDKRAPLIKDFVPLADLDDIVFGAWDPIPDDALTAAKKAGVLEERDIDPIADFLRAIKPMPAVFDNKYVTRIHGTTVKKGKTKLAQDRGVPISGKDFKTGQTWMKTIVAPGLKARMLGLAGWYSTNILGNRDGEVLDDPQSFKTKEESKLSVLHTILQPELYPDLYKDFSHVVRINYYPPRGDNKEGWDNIDIVGWMNYPMQIKINFLCRDSILA